MTGTRLISRAALLAALLLAGCENLETGPELAEEDVRRALPTQEFSDVTLTHSEHGRPVFELEAPRLDRYDFEDRAEFYGGILVRFYDDGTLSSRLTAERGEVRERGEELVAIGNVVVTTDTGTTILTPRLRWTRMDKLIKSDTTVTIITEYDTLYGTGLIASDDLKRRRILNPTGVSHRNAGDRRGGGLLLSSPRAGEEDKAAGAREPPDTLAGGGTPDLPPGGGQR
ncbi:MAG: Lipopolysaccharide export system protein LptC [Calditrichaeota bacterium]|nr:Lipopolysaccharide export system protein LptC [Calditrichota bacterium]